MEPRPYGPFPYRPTGEAPPLTWPNGARVAFVIVPNVEYFPLDSRIPYSSLVEQMGLHRKPLHAYAYWSRPARAYMDLWREIAARL